jgi:AcrR family transcriptional regulator
MMPLMDFASLSVNTASTADVPPPRRPKQSRVRTLGSPHRLVRSEAADDGRSMATERGAERRARRRDELTVAATELVNEHGLEGLTMQALAGRVDCAVGTIYTYFPSKSALLAALMSDAVQLLLDTFHAASAHWDDALSGVSPDVASLARVLAFTELFVDSRELHPQEFRFLQMLITTPESLIDPDDVASVLPSSLSFLSEVNGLVETAVGTGALQPPADGDDDGLRRTLRWTGSIHGALLVSNVAHVSGLPSADAFDPHVLTEQVTVDLLRAWGADNAHVASARTLCAVLTGRSVVSPTG